MLLGSRPLDWAFGLCKRCSLALGLAVTQVRRAHGDLRTRYEALVAAGELHFDPHQLNAVEHLQRLQAQLTGYHAPSPPGLLSKVSGRVYSHSACMDNVHVYVSMVHASQQPVLTYGMC